MRTEKILEAIGNIDDKLIAEAAPVARSKVRHIHWVKYGSIAACFLLFIILVYGISTIRMGSKSMAADTAMPEEFGTDGAASTESAIEEDIDDEADVTTDSDIDTDVKGNAEADIETDAEAEVSEDNESVGEGAVSDTHYDIAYIITVNDKTYLPISFEQRKEFQLVPKEAVGLTPENTYQITAEDLGEIIGVVSSCEEEDYLGLTLYHFIQYPEQDSIAILDNNGTYEFYVQETN